MFARTPHFEDFRALPFGSDFSTDNTKVWDLISKTFKSHPAWTVVRPFQKVKDGRAAYFALYKHYLGSSSVDNMSTSAENNLKNAVYKGETKKFNFDKYARIQMEQHQILSDLKEHGYAGIDERSKVRHLMNGIQTATLDSVKNTILASAALRVDFTGCVDLYKQFIHQSSTESEEQSLMIAKIETEGGGGEGRYKGRRGGARGGNKHAASVKCEDRFYSREEYRRLLPGNRTYLRQIRDKRKGNTVGQEGSNKRMKAVDGQKFERSLAVLASAVDSLQVTAATQHNVTPPASTPAPAPAAASNSTNSALQRIQTRQSTVE